MKGTISPDFQPKENILSPHLDLSAKSVSAGRMNLRSKSYKPEHASNSSFLSYKAIETLDGDHFRVAGQPLLLADRFEQHFSPQQQQYPLIGDDSLSIIDASNLSPQSCASFKFSSATSTSRYRSGDGNAENDLENARREENDLDAHEISKIDVRSDMDSDFEKSPGIGLTHISQTSPLSVGRTMQHLAGYNFNQATDGTPFHYFFSSLMDKSPEAVSASVSGGEEREASHTQERSQECSVQNTSMKRKAEESFEEEDENAYMHAMHASDSLEQDLSFNTSQQLQLQLNSSRHKIARVDGNGELFLNSSFTSSAQNTPHRSRVTLSQPLQQQLQLPHQHQQHSTIQLYPAKSTPASRLSARYIALPSPLPVVLLNLNFTCTLAASPTTSSTTVSRLQSPRAIRNIITSSRGRATS